MNKLNSLDWVALVLVIIGGLNWAFFGLFEFDLVAWVFSPLSVLARIIYVLVGLSALYLLATAGKLVRK